MEYNLIHIKYDVNVEFIWLKEPMNVGDIIDLLKEEWCICDNAIEYPIEHSTNYRSSCFKGRNRDVVNVTMYNVPMKPLD